MVSALIERLPLLPGRLAAPLREMGAQPLIGLLALLVLLRQPSVLLASDRVEEQLSRELGTFAAAKLGDTGPALSAGERAYLFFLAAVYGRDAAARESAEALYRQIDQPSGKAFLGSIEILKARDLAEGSVFRGLFYSFKRLGFVRRGTEALDRIERENPNDLDVRVVRAITYLQLPSVFGKFQEGFSDMKTILQWIAEGKANVPDDEPLFRDRSSLYYHAGLYYLKIGQREEAMKMFLISSEASTRSPFSRAARQRLLPR